MNFTTNRLWCRRSQLNLVTGREGPRDVWQSHTDCQRLRGIISAAWIDDNIDLVKEAIFDIKQNETEPGVMLITSVAKADRNHG
ncbi:hypothetical protein GCM10009813_03700 [Brevibacterium marinum]